MVYLYGCPGIMALLTFALFQVIQCAPAISPLPIHPIYSLPPLQPSSFNASDNGNCASPAKFPTWTSNDWVIEDCYIAVQQLFLREVHNHPDVSYQFVAKGVVPTKSPLDSQRTPRKYIFSRLIRHLIRWFFQRRWTRGLNLDRNMCPNDHDAGVVQSRAIAHGHKIQQGPNGRKQLPEYL